MLFEMISRLPNTTLFFITVILLLTIWMVVVKYDQVAITYGPPLLTTFGIFGCFWGIATGLWSFNTGDIQASVPTLVDGIKTSFWASVAGANNNSPLLNGSKSTGMNSNWVAVLLDSLMINPLDY